MSEDLVNQLTLNFLISKNQLQKLNKKVKETTDQTKIREIQEYSDRIKTLFNNLLVCQPPDDLLFEVKNAFDTFIDKSIYYFRAHDNNEALELERTNNAIRDEIHEDIDYEREEREIEKGNYQERSDFEEDELESEEEDDDENVEEVEEDDELDTNIQELSQPYQIKAKNIVSDHIVVKSKYNKTTNSVGVDDIQKLPLDWFQNVRQNYKKNQIIPRKKEPSIVEANFRDLKKKI